MTTILNKAIWVRLVFFIVLGLVCLSAGYSQDNSYNFVYTQEVLESGVLTRAAADGLQGKDVRRQITYFDGLGRPVQQLTLQKSTNGNDILNVFDYDELGREPKQFLSFTSEHNGGGFLDEALSKQSDFYQRPPYPEIPNDAFPFSETKFEASPLSRVMAKSLPGRQYDINSGVTLRLLASCEF